MHFNIHTSHGLLCHIPLPWNHWSVDRGFKGLKASWIMHQVLEMVSEYWAANRCQCARWTTTWRGVGPAIKRRPQRCPVFSRPPACRIRPWAVAVPVPDLDFWPPQRQRENGVRFSYPRSVTSWVPLRCTDMQALVSFTSQKAGWVFSVKH